MHHRFVGPLLGLVSLVGIVAVVSCSSSTAVTPPPADPVPTPPAAEAGTGCTADPGAPAGTVDANAATDPTGGADKFTLAMALAGFPDNKGKLIATINTEKSTIKCELDEKAAPISVANFVGLARGTRPYKSPAGKWKLGHFYDGLIWHRVIPDFVIQGGDPDGDGTGGPGYDLVKENQLEEPLGTLAQAAAKEPSGSQFYIVVGTGPKANYNVFGKCDTDVAKAIAAVDRDRNDAPKTPVHILKVDISRCP